MFRRLVGFTAAFWLILSGAGMTAALAYTYAVDPTSTFLRADAWAPSEARYDEPGAPLILDLSALGISPGQTLLLTQHGERTYRYSSGNVTTMNGVFSTTDQLLDNHQQYRVTGALDAGADFATSPTFDGDASDIPEDFRIDPNTLVQVPTGAAYLFIGTVDSLYLDNRDPDNDFAVSVSTVPAPSALFLIATGLISLAGTARRFRL